MHVSSIKKSLYVFMCLRNADYVCEGMLESAGTKAKATTETNGDPVQDIYQIVKRQVLHLHSTATSRDALC